MTRWLVVVLVACGSTQASSPTAPEGIGPIGLPHQSEHRRARAPFYDLPGFTRAVVSRNAATSLYDSMSDSLEVMRGDEVVCTVALHGSGNGCGHSHRFWSSVELHSREPVELDVVTYAVDDKYPIEPSAVCRRYEIPASGECRVVVEQSIGRHPTAGCRVAAALAGSACDMCRSPFAPLCDACITGSRFGP